LDGRYQIELPIRRGIPSTGQGLISGQKFFQLFSWLLFPYPGDIDFDELPIPFRCVTVDLITGRQVVLKKGSLAQALRATMSIPSLLSPVEWDEYLLVDGGLLNNFPVDVVKEMGAEIVIAVDLGAPLDPRSELVRAEKILDQAIRAVILDQSKNKRALADILIEPDMRGLSALDYFIPPKMAKIREQGEIAARQALPALQALKQKYGLTRSRSARQTAANKLARQHQDEIVGHIIVAGNNRLPAPFILKSFGLKSGDRVDGTKILRRVDELYSLGYFESVHYDVFMQEGSAIDVRLTVREKPRAGLNLGLRYDNYHKLVAAAGLSVSNIPFPGLRLESELVAVGQTRFRSKISYLTRTLNFPVYPLFYAGYKDIPSRLYEATGEMFTSYENRSVHVGAGFGLILRKSYNLEISYEQEAMKVRLRTTVARPELLTGLGATLRKISLTAGIDTLDNIRLPREGILFRALYEGSLKLLDTDLPYRTFEFSIDAYKSFAETKTVRVYGYWGSSTGGPPFYKFLNQGWPHNFIGMRYDQLQGHRMKVLRGEYRHKYTNFIYLKFIGNVAFDFEQRQPGVTYAPNMLWGVGAGVLVPTPAGPIELIYSVGSKSLLEPTTLQSAAYLVIGARF
ncbi:MAG: patatin-like phospholipase family protein, partial [Acidobacteriota bacterium]